MHIFIISDTLTYAALIGRFGCNGDFIHYIQSSKPNNSKGPVSRTLIYQRVLRTQ